MQILLLVILLTGLSIQAVECTGTQGGAATSSQDAEAYLSRGIQRNNIVDLDGALAEYRTALRLAPNDVRAHNNLGNALRETGDLDGALAEYRTALRLAPNDVRVHLNLGDA